MKNNLSELLSFPEKRIDVANFYEGEIDGKIFATRLVYFNELINASDREVEIFEKYNDLAVRGIEGLGLGSIRALLDMFPGGKLSGCGDGREMYMRVVA
jgi:hypothetical protein